MDDRWLDDTRTSYDTVAASYADLLRDELAGLPCERAVLGLFVELVGRGGAVADVGCGPGRVTAHLQQLGLEAFGIDLSPAMVDVARRDHPGLRFEVGSMTDLDLPGASLAGLLAWYSLIHVPDDAVPRVLSGFHRVLRPGAVVLLGFKTGDHDRRVTSGYGGHRVALVVHHRPVEVVERWLVEAGFVVEARTVREAQGAEGEAQGFVIARRAA